MEYNLRTMPKDVVFQFDENRYVWQTERYSTRNGNYQSETPILTTEVFALDSMGYPECEWSGGLTDNPSLYGENGLDANGCFHVFSWDMDTGKSFKQTTTLTVAPQEIQDHVVGMEPKTNQK